MDAGRTGTDGTARRRARRRRTTGGDDVPRREVASMADRAAGPRIRVLVTD
jgi:hypothetical protein